MNKRIAILVAGFMLFTNGNMVFANDSLNTNEILEANFPMTRTTSDSIITTGGSITTTEGTVTTTDTTLKCGITERVITTEKGTIEILDDGSIITTGDTTYNPKTGNFDISNPYYTNYEKIYIGGHLQEVYGGKNGDMLRYGKGATINKNYSFIYDDEIYTIDEGDIYTRWFMKNDDTNESNIMPLLSFMEMDGRWFFFQRSTILYSRYIGSDTIREIVSANQVAIRLEEDTVVSNKEQEIVLSKGSMLITTEGKPSYITDFGEIPKNTIINYQDGSVELLHEKMYIVGKNVNVRIQNMSCDNMDIEFKPYTINASNDLPPMEDDTIEPPINNKPNIPSVPSYDDNANDSDNTVDTDDSDVVVDTTQKLDKDKQYEYIVTDTINLIYKKDMIKLKKNDRIILPYGLEKIDKTLPMNTLIIKDGEEFVLRHNYTMSRNATFKKSEEKYLAFVICFRNKFHDFVIKLG